MNMYGYGAVLVSSVTGMDDRQLISLGCSTMTEKAAERAARRQGVAVIGPRVGLGLSLLVVAFAGTARAGGPPPDACALLTAADVERVQGGSLREAISSGNAAEAIASTQCFFRVDPFPRSVSLALTRAGRGLADR